MSKVVSETLAETSSELEQTPARRRRFSVDALFADTTPRSVGVRDLASAKEIELQRIKPDPNQPRRSFDDERLEELAASIRREGVLQPIAVRYDRESGDYVVLHGERRWRAAQRVGLAAIPAVVREVPEERRLLQQLMENVVREDLNAIDRAAALRALKAQMNDAPWERVAESVGIRRSRLFQLLGTEKLSEAVQEELRAGRLSEKQSRVLQGLPEPAQEALARLIVDDELDAAEARRLARAARDDERFAALEADEAREQFQALRERRDQPVERSRRPGPGPAAPLERLLGPERARLAREADAVGLDELQRRLMLLAEGLATVGEAERPALEAPVLALRALFDALLA
jgi:ParB family chromosome partitioning protein